MEYHPDEVDRFFPEPKRPASKWKEKAMGALAAVGLVIAMAIAASGEIEAFAGTAEVEEETFQVQSEVMKTIVGMPCTWVAQCGTPISDCPVQDRKCVNTDLTERK